MKLAGTGVVFELGEVVRASCCNVTQYVMTISDIITLCRCYHTVVQMACTADSGVFARLIVQCIGIPCIYKCAAIHWISFSCAARVFVDKLAKVGVVLAYTAELTAHIGCIFC